MKKNMVVGFMFNPQFSLVCLILKDHPEWQAGKWNGIGGKMKVGETSHETMVREFFEETGITTEIKDWKQFAQMNGDDWCVLCMAAIADEETPNPTQQPGESEVPKLVTVRLIQDPEFPKVENLEWLILMAIDFLQDGRPSYVNIDYPRSR